MTFQVNITPRAIADIEKIHAYLSKNSTEAAERITVLLTHGIESLTDLPSRYARAPESQHSSIELRQMIVGNYRAVYSIILHTVTVWRVIHAARTLNPFEFH